jgi:hypothetical protein
MIDHDTLIDMLTRLKLTAIRDQLDTLLDEAARREMTLREALGFLCQREIARKDERRIEMGGKIAHFPTWPASTSRPSPRSTQAMCATSPPVGGWLTARPSSFWGRRASARPTWP